MVTQVSETEWEVEFADGDRNSVAEVKATEDGIEINYSTIPWEQIDKARAALEGEDT